MLEPVATAIWDKYGFKLSKNVICEDLVDYLFSDELWIRKHSATGLVKAIASTPTLRAVLMYNLYQKFRQSKFKDGFVQFIKELPELDEQEADELIGFILEVAEFKDSTLVNLGLFVLEKFQKSEQILYNIQSTLHQGESGITLVFMAYLAQFLGETHGSIDDIIYSLIDALEDNKEELFVPILKSLPTLLSHREFMREELAIELQDKLLLEPSRGVAYAIGGLFAAGLAYEKLDRVWAVIYSKRPQIREKLAVLLAIEGISVAIGGEVDAYLKEFVPFILDCFSVTEITDQSSRTLLQLTKQLNQQSIRVMINLLKFDSVNWKTKVGSLQAIGNLALGAPKIFLKDIVPEVVKSFSDTHKNVLSEARRAIGKIGKVIVNPEIAKIVRPITVALSDATKVHGALKLLSDTRFQNEIDAASLSLIMPIIEKGLKAKDIDVKLVACKALREVSRFTAATNLLMYFDRLLPSFTSALFDSIPDVRNTAAETIGGMVQYMGPVHGMEIVNWLESKLLADCNGIERMGATYAYSQCIPFIDWSLEHIMARCSHETTYVRESYLELLSYLTTEPVFLENFDQICNIMYENISHNSTEVREASVKVMKSCILHYSKSHLDTIIQPLEDGLFSENWRTRQSSLYLMGILLETLVKRDRKEGTSSLPDATRHRILAAIFLLRSDKSSNISVIAAQTWNKVVENTQKLLPFLTPILVRKVLYVVEQNSEDTLEVIICSFEGILNNYQEAAVRDWLPHIIKQMDEFPSGTQLLTGMIIDRISGIHLSKYIDDFTQVLNFLLRLPDSNMRDRSGKIFFQLYNKTSNEQVTSEGAAIILNLLELLEDSPISYQQLVRWGNKNIVRNTMFRVMKFKESKYKIMASISGIIGQDILENPEIRHFFPQMLDELGIGMLDAICELGASLQVHDSVQYFLETVERTDVRYQLQILKHFCQKTKFNFAIYINYLLDIIIELFDHQNLDIVKHISETVTALIKPMAKEDQHTIMWKIAKAVDHKITLFSVPKGVECLLPILQNSLFNGPPDTRELAAKSYRNILQFTEPAFIEKFVVNMAGPLIRVVGERVPTELKVEAHRSLFLLMQKGKAKMKVFTAQLQSTFTKAFQQSDQAIQEVSRENLFELLNLNPKLELLLSDLGKSSSQEGVALLAELLEKVDVGPNERKAAWNKVQNSQAPFKKEVASLLFPDVTQITFTPETVDLLVDLLPANPDLSSEVTRLALEGAAVPWGQLTVPLEGILTELFEAISWDIYKYMGVLEKIPAEIMTEKHVKLILPALAEAFDENEENDEIDEILTKVLRMESGNEFAESCLDELEGNNLETIANYIDSWE